MPSLQLYDTLYGLSLFQGLSRNDLSEIVAQIRFGFHKAADGECVMREGDTCDKLVFLINGKLRIENQSVNRRYSITEEINAPTVLQPERLFGLKQRYTTTYIAVGQCNFIALDKQEVMKLSDNFIIFRMNLLNIISTIAQKQSQAIWRSTPLSVRERIIHFIEQRCQRPAGEKHIKIRMEDLAEEISDSRLNVSRALNAMQDEGLISLGRGSIHIPQVEMLIQICNIR